MPTRGRARRATMHRHVAQKAIAAAAESRTFQERGMKPRLSSRAISKKHNRNRGPRNLALGELKVQSLAETNLAAVSVDYLLAA
jgi:hypothetical protein